MARQRTEEWSFEEYKKWMNEMRDNYCIEQDDDLMILFCGNERSFKSTDALFWATVLDPNFISKNICFLSDEYKNLNISAMGNRMDEIEKEVFLEDNRYNIDIDNLWGMNSHLNKGSVVIYDEAGTELSSQKSLDSDVIEQQDILIINGWINLVHCLNVPKPRSIHFYPREERCKLMLWHHKEFNKDTKEKVGHVYGYDRVRYISMLQDHNWYKAFAHTFILINKYPPTFHVVLPDLRSYIKPEILKRYMAVKMMYSIAKAQGNLRGKNKNPDDIANIILKRGDIKVGKSEIVREFKCSYTIAEEVRRKIKKSTRPNL